MGPRLPELQQPLDSTLRQVIFEIFGMSCTGSGAGLMIWVCPFKLRVFMVLYNALLKVMSHTRNTRSHLLQETEVLYQPPQVSTPSFVIFLLCIGICEAF